MAEDDLADDGASNKYVAEVREMRKRKNSESICDLCTDRGRRFLNWMMMKRKCSWKILVLTESGLEKLVAASYQLLGLISFLTAGEDESRAWTIKKGTKAPQAAGKIHTDFERGFIKAEVVNYKDLMELWFSMQQPEKKGLFVWKEKNTWYRTEM